MSNCLCTHVTRMRERAGSIKSVRNNWGLDVGKRFRRKKPEIPHYSFACRKLWAARLHSNSPGPSLGSESWSHGSIPGNERQGYFSARPQSLNARAWWLTSHCLAQGDDDDIVSETPRSSLSTSAEGTVDKQVCQRIATAPYPPFHILIHLLAHAPAGVGLPLERKDHRGWLWRLPSDAKRSQRGAGGGNRDRRGGGDRQRWRHLHDRREFSLSPRGPIKARKQKRAKARGFIVCFCAVRCADGLSFHFFGGCDGLGVVAGGAAHGRVIRSPVHNCTDGPAGDLAGRRATRQSTGHTAADEQISRAGHPNGCPPKAATRNLRSWQRAAEPRCPKSIISRKKVQKLPRAPHRPVVGSCPRATRERKCDVTQLTRHRRGPAGRSARR